MKPASFDYVRAESLSEALSCLDQFAPRVRVLAGGLSQVAMMNFRLVEPATLIDIGGISELKFIRVADGAVEVGAGTTQAELKEWKGLAESLPLLHAALPYVGHYQTRNRGTVCGSIVHSDPSSELPLCLATLGGQVVLRSARGSRALSADQFQRGMLSVEKEPNEMVTHVRFPLRASGTGYAFQEVSRRRGDFAIVGVAACVSAQSIRLGVGGVADRPTVRQWERLQGRDLDEALNVFAWDMGGSDDIHAPASYRRELVRRIGRRAIEAADQCRS
ncbi:MAG: FAD binding domain-containing protein [Hyphomicrobiales bacterium]|nr:FAD binding domain-containing protein [Hyphomicrobiales bacterium]